MCAHAWHGLAARQLHCALGTGDSGSPSTTRTDGRWRSAIRTAGMPCVAARCGRERSCVRENSGLLFTQCCSHARILPQKPHVDDDARTRATHLALSALLLALASLSHYTRLVVRTDMSPCVPLASGPCVRVGDCGDYPPNPTFHEARCSSMQRRRTCASACACRSPRQQGTRWPHASSDRGQSTP
jgi:hypothetical protein